VDDDDLDEALAAIEDQLGDDPEGALAALERLPADVQAEPEALFLRALALWSIEGPEAAAPAFEAVIAEDPGFADAHYSLAEVCEAIGDEDGMRRHFLAVLALDAADDAARGLGSAGALDAIAATAEAALGSVPDELRGRLGNVAVVLEARPSWEVVSEGFDPRALGMFEGPDDLTQRSGEVQVMASRIVLFYANLLASFADEGELHEEVEVTVLHEIGHYFGLDEDGVGRLGLE